MQRGLDRTKKFVSQEVLRATITNKRELNTMFDAKDEAPLPLTAAIVSFA